MAAYIFLQLYTFQYTIVLPQISKLSMPWVLITPYHHRCWLLNGALLAIWMVLFPLKPQGHNTHDFQNLQYLICRLIRPKDIFSHFVSHYPAWNHVDFFNAMPPQGLKFIKLCFLPCPCMQRFFPVSSTIC